MALTKNKINSKHTSTLFHLLYPSWFQWLDPTKTVCKIYTYFNQISPIDFRMISPVGPTKIVCKIYMYFNQFNPCIELDFTAWFQHDLNWWIQLKKGLQLCKMYTYFNQISPVGFNLISPVDFKVISPFGSTWKRFAKSMCISARFHHWIQPEL